LERLIFISPLVSVTRGEKPTEEMTKNFMQNLANNLEKLEERYAKEKGNAAPCVVSERSSLWLDIDVFSSKLTGLTADQWKRIDEIHSTLMRERRMQQKPGTSPYCFIYALLLHFKGKPRLTLYSHPDCCRSPSVHCSIGSITNRGRTSST